MRLKAYSKGAGDFLTVSHLSVAYDVSSMGKVFESWLFSFVGVLLIVVWIEVIVGVSIPSTIPGYKFRLNCPRSVEVGRR